VYAAADSLPQATFPIKIAVFEFELEDFSAAGQTKSVPETSHLAQATDEAEQQLRASGRYTVIDAVHSDQRQKGRVYGTVEVAKPRSL
jgi:predicted kinase